MKQRRAYEGKGRVELGKMRRLKSDSFSKQSAPNARDHLQCRRPRFYPWDLPEKEMATHFSILAWETQWTEELGRLQSIGSQELDMT